MAGDGHWHQGEGRVQLAGEEDVPVRADDLQPAAVDDAHVGRQVADAGDDGPGLDVQDVVGAARAVDVGHELLVAGQGPVHPRLGGQALAGHQVHGGPVGV